MSTPARLVGVVVGVDGSGRSHELDRVVAVSRDRRVRPVPADADDAAVRRLLDEAASDTLVVLDDAHRRPAAVLDLLLQRLSAPEAGHGLEVVLARRPGPPPEPLARLEEAVVARRAAVVATGPLDADAIRGLVEAAGGSPAQVETATTTSAGAAWVAAAIAGGLADGHAPDRARDRLAAAVDRRLASLPPGAVDLAVVLAVATRLSVRPGVTGLARALADRRPATPQADLADAAAAAHALRQAGLLDLTGGATRPRAPADREAQQASGDASGQEADRLVPAVADVLVERLTAGERAAVETRLALALAVPAEPGEESAADLAEARVALGLGEVDPTASPLVAACVAARAGHTERAARHLLDTGDTDVAVEAVPGLVATGRWTEAAEVLRDAGADPRPADPARHLARAALAVAEATPRDALPELVEAIERPRAALARPVLDTPHALACVVAVAAGDGRTAERLATTGERAVAGGPELRRRHRLLAAWVRLRTRRADPTPLLRDVDAEPLPGRDDLLAVALRVGWARRRGDVVAMRASWDRVSAVLVRRRGDLLTVEAVEELAVTAVRVDQAEHAAPLVADLEAMAAGGPAAWLAATSWLRLQAAAVGDDAAAAATAAAGLADAASLPTAGPRQCAQARAGRVWADVLAGDIGGEDVLAAVEDLAGVAELPWEAGRMAGQAAVRETDPAAAKRLLERARELSGTAESRLGAPTSADTAAQAGLSDREVEVARLVLAGRTHREIGSQLYISPKTVEHHVARIRGKVGSGSRAEFMAALRTMLGDGPAPAAS